MLRKLLTVLAVVSVVGILAPTALALSNQSYILKFVDPGPGCIYEVYKGEAWVDSDPLNDKGTPRHIGDHPAGEAFTEVALEMNQVLGIGCFTYEGGINLVAIVAALGNPTRILAQYQWMDLWYSGGSFAIGIDNYEPVLVYINAEDAPAVITRAQEIQATAVETGLVPANYVLAEEDALKLAVTEWAKAWLKGH